MRVSGDISSSEPGNDDGHKTQGFVLMENIPCLLFHIGVA